jgi:hypothetical protein
MNQLRKKKRTKFKITVPSLEESTNLKELKISLMNAVTLSTSQVTFSINLD